MKDFIAAIQDFQTGAGARRESEELVLRAKEKLATLEAVGFRIVQRDGADDFEIEVARPENLREIFDRLSDIQGLLEQAQSNWGGNPEIADLRDRAKAGLAHISARSGDLQLAKHLVDQIQSPRQRASILESIEEQEALIRRKDHIRRVSLAGTTILLLILVVGTVIFTREQTKANERLRAESELAAQLRDEAIRERMASERASRLAEEEAYFAKMNLASFALRDGNLSRVNHMLMESIQSPLRHWEWGHLLGNIFNDQMTLARESVENTLLSGAFSPDGRWIYSGSRDGTLYKWNASTGALVATAQPHEEGIWDIVPSDDSSTLLLTSFDRTATIVDAQTLEVVRRFVGHENLLRGGTFSPDNRRVITTGRDNTARVWDVETGEEIARLPGIEHATYAARFSPDGQRLAVTQRRIVSLFDATSLEYLFSLEEHPENVLDIAWSPDGTRLVTACTDRFARIFDMEGGELLHTMHHETSWLHSTAWSADGETVVTGGNESEIRFWNPEDGSLRQILIGHPRVFHLRFSPDGRHLLTVSPRALQLWDVNALPHPDGIIVLRTDEDSTAAEADELLVARSSPLEREGAWAGFDWAYRRSTDRSGRRIFKSADTRVAVDSFYTAVEPNGHRALHIDHIELTAVVEDTRTGEIVAQWPGDEQLVFARWSPDGEHLAVITKGGIFALHDKETLERRVVLGEPSPIDHIVNARLVGTLAFDHESRRVVTGRREGAVQVWSVEDGSLIHDLGIADSGGIFAVAFSPDGTLVAAGGRAARTTVWNAQTAEQIARLVGHQEYIIDLAIHPDNTRIATASHDNSVKLWELARGREIMTVHHFPDERFLLGTGFSRSGREIYAVVSDGTVHVARALSWTGEGSVEEILAHVEFEKRRDRWNPDVRLDDISTVLMPELIDAR